MSPLCDVCTADLGQDIDTEETGHPVQIVLVSGHSNHLEIRDYSVCLYF